MSKINERERAPNETIILTVPEHDIQDEMFEEESEYPFCALHSEYFAFALHALEQGRKGFTLSVESANRGDILPILRKQ